MSYGLAQARYASDATETVSASRLLTMLYDRLLSDLAVAEQAMQDGDPATVGDRIGRAQEILLELHATLDIEIWPEGEPLARLYLWMISELMTARLHRAPHRVAECHNLLVPLRDAWYAASAAESPDGLVTPSQEVPAPVTGQVIGEVAGTTRVPGGGLIPVDGATHGGLTWPEYLDLVEATARSIGEQAADGYAPVWPVLAAPAGLPPEHLSERLHEVLGLLAETATRVESRRDAVGVELAGLTRRVQGTHRPGPGRVGGRFDVLG